MNKEMLNKAIRLIGKEFDIRNLSNELVEVGYEDICWFGNWEEILESGCVIVADNDGENKIMIDFKVVIKNNDDEIAEASVIMITAVEEC